jgi:hypothetical protein
MRQNEAGESVAAVLQNSSQTMQDPSLSHNRPGGRCLLGTFSPSWQHIRWTRPHPTWQPAPTSDVIRDSHIAYIGTGER